MPKGPCDKRKRTNDPKCTDKPECDWYPGKGCYPKGTTFEDKPEKKSASKSKSKSTSVDDAAAILAAMQREAAHSDFATIFLVKLPQGKFEYPEFPRNIIFVRNNEDKLDGCYSPKWIYREDTRTNHIKCKSESEYDELSNTYYQQRDAAEKEWSTQTLILQNIIANGGKLGDLVVDIDSHNYGYRTGGVYVLVNDNETGQLEISPLGTEIDDYGNIPPSLSLDETFKPGYWSYAFDNGEHIDLANPDNQLQQSQAYWHESEVQLEPLHRTKLKGLRKTQIKQDENGYLFIDLKFMKLKYTGRMTHDELHSALRARNLDDKFLAYDDTLYVRPVYNEPGTSYIEHGAYTVPSSKEGYRMEDEETEEEEPRPSSPRNAQLARKDLENGGVDMTKGSSRFKMIAHVDGTLTVNGEVIKKFDDTDEMERRARQMLEEKIKEGYRVEDEPPEEYWQRQRDLTTMKAYINSHKVLRDPKFQETYGYLYPELGLTEYLA